MQQAGRCRIGALELLQFGSTKYKEWGMLGKNSPVPLKGTSQWESIRSSVKDVGRQYCKAASGSSLFTNYCWEHTAGFPHHHPQPSFYILVRVAVRAGSCAWLCFMATASSQQLHRALWWLNRRVRPSAPGQTQGRARCSSYSDDSNCSLKLNCVLWQAPPRAPWASRERARGSRGGWRQFV